MTGFNKYATAITIFVLFSLVFINTPAIVQALTNSTTGNFSVSNDVISFNWTPYNLTIISNVVNTTVNLTNTTSSIIPTYFSTSTWASGEYPSLNSTNWTICLNNGMRVTIRDSSDNLNGQTDYINITDQNWFRLYAPDFCPPGKYAGSIQAFNSDNSTDNVTINVTVHVPISANNTYLNSNKTAIFKGNISANSTDYQSFYMFTNLTENLSYVTINLSGLTDDIDLFLFNATPSTPNHIKTSAFRGSTSETIEMKLSPQDFWEIRLFGNNETNQTYIGYLYFSALNVTRVAGNQTNTSLLEFGNKDVNTSSNVSIEINNTGTGILSNVNQTIDLYRVTKVAATNASHSHEFITTNYTSKIRAEVIWRQNISNHGFWSVSLLDPNKKVVDNSTNKSIAANVTGGQLMEWVEYYGPFNKTNEGIWTVSVTNTTYNISGADYVVFPDYTINITHWFNASSWFTSYWNNESIYLSQNNSYTFNQTGSSQNQSLNVTLNFAPPIDQLYNGSYGGTIRWLNGSGWTTFLPYTANVRSGLLTVNNTISNHTLTKYDNVGFNRTLSIYVPYNNSGFHTFTLELTNPGQLNLSGSSSNISVVTSSVINPLFGGNDSSGNLTINLTLNTTVTGFSSTGLYKGWLFFNTTNSSNITSQSYPYNTFNLSLIVNLSDNLFGNITRVNLSGPSTPWINATGNGTWLNFTVKPFFANESEAFSGSTANFGDGGLYFTNVSIVENMVGTTYYPTNISKSGAGTMCAAGDGCNISALFADTVPGGHYTLLAYSVWNGTGNMDLSGYMGNTSLLVNGSGINITIPIKAYEMTEEHATPLNITVYNAGPQTALGKLLINRDDALTIKNSTITGTNATYDNATCYTNKGESFFTLSLPANTSCWYYFHVVGDNVTSNTTESLTIWYNTTEFNESAHYASESGITVRVNEVAGAGGGGDDDDDDTTGGGGGGGGGACSLNADCASGYYCSSGSCTALSCAVGQYAGEHDCLAYNYTMRITPAEENVAVKLGESVSTTVNVKNIGNIAFTGKLGAESVLINSTVSPSSYSFGVGKNTTFTITFSTTETVLIGNHTVTLKAYKSDDSSISNSYSIIVSVNPTEAKKTHITGNQTNLTAFIKELEDFYYKQKDGLDNETRLKLDVLVAGMKANISAAASAIDSGDYSQADFLHRQLLSAIDQYNARMLTSQVRTTEFWSGVSIWIVVAIVIIVIAGFVIYLLLPPKKGQPKFRVAKPKSKSGGGFGKIFKKKPKGPTSYNKTRPRQMYKPQQAPQRQYQTGYQRNSNVTYGKKAPPKSGGGFRSIFKRKKKQETLKDFAKK